MLPSLPLADIDLTASNVLVVVAIVLAVVSFFKPAPPLLAIAVILIGAALLVA